MEEVAVDDHRGRPSAVTVARTRRHIPCDLCARHSGIDSTLSSVMMLRRCGPGATTLASKCLQFKELTGQHVHGSVHLSYTYSTRNVYITCMARLAHQY